MKLTDEQLENLIKMYERANDDDLGLTISALKELQELRKVNKGQHAALKEIIFQSNKQKEIVEDILSIVKKK